MKRLFICSCFFVMLVACRENHQHIINTADEIANVKPDSALYLLETIDFPNELNEPEKAAYGLALARTHHTKWASLAEDSLILFAVSYYEKINDSLRLFDSYHFTADYYLWLNKPELALSNYDKMLSIALDLNDSVKIAKSYIDKGYFFYKNKNYREANTAFAKSVIYNLEPYGYYLGALCNYRLDGESIDFLIEKGVEAALQKKDTISACHFLRNHASMLVAKGEFENAKKQLYRTYTLSDYYKNFSVSNIILAEISLSSQQLDSAQHYLNLAKGTRYKSSYGISTKKDLTFENSIAAMQATLDYIHTGVYKYNEIAGYNDSVIESMIIQNKLILGKNDAQNSLNNQNLKLTIEKQRKTNQLTLVCFSILAIIGIGYAYYRNRRNKLMEAEERIEALNHLLIDATSNGAEIDKIDSHFFKKILLQQLGIIRLAASAPTSQNQEFIREMSQLSNHEMPAESLLNWKDLYPIIDTVYSNFYTHLVNQYGDKLTDKEIELCCLLCAGFSTKEISVVTQQSTHTIYQRKTSIRKKLKMDEKAEIITFICQKAEPQ